MKQVKNFQNIFEQISPLEKGYPVLLKRKIGMVVMCRQILKGFHDYIKSANFVLQEKNNNKGVLSALALNLWKNA